MKKQLLTILLCVGVYAVWGQAAYRTKVTTGNWSDTSTWERSTTGGASWVPLTSSSQIPAQNDSVFIQNGHSVTLTQAQSCYDLNISSATGQRINLATFKLSLFGRLRCVSSAINTWPVTYTSSTPSTTTWINTTGAGSAISVVGNTRNLTNTSEWGNNPPGWRLEINLNAGQTVTNNTGMKLARLVVNSGTLYTAAGFDVRPDSGVALGGDIIIAAGATLSLGGATRRTGTAGMQYDSLVVNGTFEIRGSTGTPGVDVVNMIVNAGGNVKMSNTVAYTYSITNSVYNTSAALQYTGTSAQTVGGEWPATLALKKLVVNNSAGITIPFTRTITDSLVMTSGNITIPVTDSLILGASANGVLVRTAGTIIGRLNRFIASTTTGNVLYPVGSSTYYRPINANFVQAPLAAGNISIMHLDSGIGGANITAFTDGSYSVNRRSKSGWSGSVNGSGFAALNITLTVDMPGQSGIATASETRIIGSLDAGATYGTAGGTHSAGSGTQASRTGFQTASTIRFWLFLGGNASSNPLPVKWLGFDGVYHNKTVNLNWSTASEHGNSHFEMERSLDGFNFTAIGRIGAKGTSNTVSKYVFTDAYLSTINQQPSTIYYRVKQVDMDGDFEYSKTITLNVQEKMEVVIGPNPFEDMLEISVKSNLAKYNVEVFDIRGRVQHQSTETGKTFYINTTNMHDGIYFIRINNGMETLVRRIVKR